MPSYETARPVMGSAPRVHSRVVKPSVKMGTAWVGVIALATIGALAVVYGREHEEDSKLRKRAMQARGG
tara:strand:- start:148 stop:354 length:207 start_codon:yes stop_codon:yes gene_type:complete